MIRNFTQKEYEAKAAEVKGLDFLYVLQHEVEVEREVLEWDYIEKEVEQQKIDPETGEPMYDEEGNPIMETVTIRVAVPRMVKETIIDPETGEEIEVEVQAHHTEKFMEMQEDLMIDERFKFTIIDGGNTTNGEVNPNFEEERQEFINTLKMTKRVFAMMLEQVGISYKEIKELIAKDERVQMEWELCVELLRGNDKLDPALEAVGISKEMLNGMFLVANGLMQLEELKKLAK